MPNEIGLITKDESFKSNVTKQESDDFFGIVNQQPDNAKNEENVQKNNGDIFDELD